MIAHYKPEVKDAMASGQWFNREVRIIHIGDVLSQLVAQELLPELAATRIYNKHWHKTKPLYQPSQLSMVSTG